ncbi:hypothetical protein ZIOFF_073519 [Zingiber officinale]|uniref:S-acyltransferase n=1 Tax=Zingiber officinale TaxID=94328 RepID=A0A8J5EPC0_ZINOF|nr:hypothetical protein ZIOFF_073519 [Zingiber officinale]
MGSRAEPQGKNDHQPDLWAKAHRTGTSKQLIASRLPLSLHLLPHLWLRSNNPLSALTSHRYFSASLSAVAFVTVMVAQISVFVGFDFYKSKSGVIFAFVFSLSMASLLRVMRKHGWQLPYHPLQVVAIAVFLALGFAFYVFFVPFVGKKLFQYVVMGLYTPLVVSVFFLYIWCAATDPADPGIFRPKKSLKVGDYREQTFSKESKPEDSTKELNAEITAAKQLDGSVNSARHELHSELESGRLPGCITTFLAILLSWCGLSFLCNLCQSHEQSSEQQLSDEGMFYCSLCEVEFPALSSASVSVTCVPMVRICGVGGNKEEEGRDGEETMKGGAFKAIGLIQWVAVQKTAREGMQWVSIGNESDVTVGIGGCLKKNRTVLKYSKHCRVCDKCVDGFDHHCRWINNCIGRKNYKRFFILMVFALLLWAVGMLVLILCFVERRRFSAEIVSKLGSSFSLAPFIIVVAVCTLLAMVATLPVAQLFFFHILLIKKGISTYDYIIALREQDQEQEQLAVGGQQSPQMSQVSSFTGLSSTSSFNQFHRGAWCTPPRLFLEDQFDVVPPEIGSSANHKNKKMAEEPVKRRNPGTVKINPWTLARLNAEEVSKAAAQARKRSKILQPVRRETLQEQETESSVDSASGRMALRSDNRKRINKRGRVPVDLPLEPLAKISASATDSNASDLAPETSTSLAPLQLEARNAFRPSMPMSLTRAVSSSPESSLDSPDLHPFRISSSGTEEVQGMNSFSALGNVPPKGIHLSRSTSDGYEASGGEDSDRIPSRIVHRSSNWASIVLGSEHSQITDDLKSYTRQQ